MIDSVFGLRYFGALFAIMNPLMVLPLFLALTAGLTAAEQRRTGLAVTLYSAAMCAAIALGGQRILDFFGIGIEDFRVAGGLVLAGIALNMLNGAGNPAHEGGPGEATRLPTDAAFYPLTFPMVVGPGTITTLLVFGHEAGTAADRVTFWTVTAAMLALLGLTLTFAAAIGHHLSATLRVIMSRLMGMILLAIAVSMLATGIKALLPALG
ncbi:MarC family protein [uncultured Amaricoccus sp.]|uniref:MarC family protein n=1 Tax=uncultured Amaricoccus sp. TaxID=339341 RepID=UPI00260ABF06|nr:MarC family protein [uncultured Amaricoccus sp.]